MLYENRIAEIPRESYENIACERCPIRELCCIRPYLDFKTASTIATSIVHSKLDYCNSLYYNLPKSHTNRLQAI